MTEARGAAVMQYETPDPNLLAALDALLCERNVTRAAERLFSSQSRDARCTVLLGLKLPWERP